METRQPICEDAIAPTLQTFTHSIPIESQKINAVVVSSIVHGRKLQLRKINN